MQPCALREQEPDGTIDRESYTSRGLNTQCTLMRADGRGVSARLVFKSLDFEDLWLELKERLHD